LNSTKSKYIYNYYDLIWTITDIELGRRYYKRDPNTKIKWPKNLKLLIKYTEKLSKEFVFVRVDFYEIKNKLNQRELTFSPSNIIMHLKIKNKEFNCIECKINYIDKNGLIYNFLYELNKNKFKNCYVKCPYHFYKNVNKFICTLNLSCPKEYPILLENQMKCIESKIQNILVM